MRFDLALSDGPTAFVFPGQGAHGPGMLEPFRDAPGFATHYERVCALVGGDPLAIADRDTEFLNRNAVSSLFTVLASVACLELAREHDSSFQPVAAAGYSVGQWTALYAGGSIGVEDLFRVVAERARLMDECVAGARPSGMLAVIGVGAADLEAVCGEATERGDLLEIANHNAPGQYTLGGNDTGLDFAEKRLAPLRPKRLARLPVAAAWHSRILEGAVEPLASFLEGVPIGAPRVPIIDNTSGGWLPHGEGERRAALARQVAHPVLWMQGIRTMAGLGVRHTIEIGYGDVLTKFGFFIDRSLRHQAAAPPPRTRP